MITFTKVNSLIECMTTVNNARGHYG